LLGFQQDGSDANNGTVGQLNIDNGFLEQGNQERMTQTAMQTCLIEQTALANKIQRDNIAAEMNRQALNIQELETVPTGWDGSNTFTTPLP
jgi:hypothetical protein